MILLDPEARPIIAHRGASGTCPENTLLAFDRALEYGADALELDVRLSADGVPVVIHDSTLERTTDGRGPVGAWPLERLRALDAGGGERIPTLADVLERYPTTPIIVDIKELPCAQPVAALLLVHRAAGRVLVGAFARRALRPFDLPAYHRAAARSETALAWLGSRVNLAVGGRFRAFTVPRRYRGVRVVDRRFVAAAARRGRPVHVWTVNHREEAERLRAMGIAGIITDHPERMRSL